MQDKSITVSHTDVFEKVKILHDLDESTDNPPTFH